MRADVLWLLRGGLAGLLLLTDPAAPSAEPAEAGLGPWLGRALDLGPSDRRNAELAGQKASFVPLGFSKDGWFAFVSRASGAEGPPEGAELVNLRCESTDCLTDAPSSAQDVCYCLFGAGAAELRKHKIAPFAQPPKQGVFPAAFGGDVLDIELVLIERGIPSEAHTPGKTQENEFPRTDVVLTSRLRGKKVIGSIDHNHADLAFGSAYPLGWLQSPHERRVVILVGGVQPSPCALTIRPFWTSLDSGFAK